MTTTRTLEQPPAVDRGRHYPHRRSLLAGELLLGVAAVAGSVQLVTGVSTPPDADLPDGLSSWALPGLWLFVMVAVPSLASAALVARRNVDAPVAVWCATVLLVVELLVQIPFLGLNVLQVVCAGIGSSLAVLAARAHADGWRRRRPVHAKSAATIAATAGMLTTAFGAGIGVRYLTKTGLTMTAFLGLLTLVAGLALLAYAWVIAWRATRRWQRLWFVPVVVVALLLMTSVAQGTMLALSPRNGLGSATPADRGLTFSDVTFRTSDGVRLSGWYVASTNRAAVVTVPGAGSTRTATLGQATVLARHGFGVLMVDPRGQGRSSGHAMDAGWYGDRDVAAAVSYLEHRPDVDPNRIAVLGLSMGGEEAIGAAAADPSIRAVVAEGATNRTAADKAGWLPGGVAGAVQRVLDRLTYGTAALLSPAPEPHSMHSAIARAETTRFLLIAAGNGVDEPEAAAYLRGAAAERVQTWTVPHASHVHGLTTSPAEWTARVTAFLDESLSVTR